MSINEKELFASIVNNDLEHVQRLLESGMILDINWRNPTASLSTALHLGAIWGHLKIVRVILNHPGANVNQLDEHGSTPFCSACSHGQLEVVRELLKIDKVDVNSRTLFGATPLSLAAYFDHISVIKAIIASEKELDVTAKVPSSWGEDVLAVEVARRRGHDEIVALLEDYERFPSRTRFRIRKELGNKDTLAAEMFALIVFFSDGFLALPSNKPSTPQQQFFHICSRLPLELQMLVANRTAGLGGEILASKHTKLALSEVGVTLGLDFDPASAEMLKLAGEPTSIRQLIWSWWKGHRDKRRAREKWREDKEGKEKGKARSE